MIKGLFTLICGLPCLLPLLHGGGNLLQHGAILSGSDFDAIPAGWKLETRHYFPMAADGDVHTSWKAAQARDPHYLTARWRIPVKINQIRWNGNGFDTARLSVWQNGTFRPVAELTGRAGSREFTELATARIRFEILNAGGIPEISELEIYGPEQLLPPAKLPDQQLSGVRVKWNKVTPAEIVAKPGDRVRFAFDAALEGNAGPRDFYLLIEMKEETIGANLRMAYGDIEIAACTVELPGLCTQAKHFQGEIALPPWMPSGKTWLKGQVLSADGKYIVPVAEPVLTVIDVTRPEAFPVYPVSTLEATVAELNGWRGFKIGPEMYPPFANHYCTTIDFERFYETRLNGSIFQNVQLYPAMLMPRRNWQEIFDRLDQEVTSILRVRPESYFMIGVDLRPSAVWKIEHPKAMMLTEDGIPLLENKRPVVSYGSPELLADSLAFFEALLDFVSRQPWHSRVIAWQPWSNTRNDSFIGGIENNRGGACREKLSLGDYHPGAIFAFQNFLRMKYDRDVERLRQAWKDEKVLFETACPSNALLGAEDGEGAFFRDPVNSRQAIDYWEFFPTLLGNYLRRIAAFIKEKTQNKALVFVHYGAVINNLTSPQPTGSRVHSSNYDLPEMLSDDNIDMYVQSMPYNRRHAGDPIVVYQPTGSITLHRRMYFADYDIRTIAAGTLNFGRHRSVHETRELIRRDLAWLLIRQSGAWFADMSQGGFRDFTETKLSWIGAPEVTKPVGEMLDLFRRQLKSNVAKCSATEMAFIFSMQTPPREDLLNSAVLYWNLIDRMFYEEVTMLGAPYDVFIADDLAHAEFPEYKLYCFVNLFYVTPDQRLAIEKLKRGEKTLLFLYAPGYVGENGFDITAASQLCGMQLKARPEPRIMSLTLDGNQSLSLLKDLAGARLDAGGWPGAAPLHRASVSPTFEVIDPKVIVLGHDDTGAVSMAMKNGPDYRTIYSAVPFLNRKLLRNIAVEAGVHMYCDEDVIMAADSRMLMFHNGWNAPRQLHICPAPGTGRVKDAFTGAVLSSEGKPFTLQMNAPESRILLVE